MPGTGIKWLECSIPIPGIMGSNPAVSGVISGKPILAANIVQSTLWRELAQCFDFRIVFIAMGRRQKKVSTVQNDSFFVPYAPADSAACNT